jgi:hypothetical protein
MYSSTLWIVGKKGERACRDVPTAVDLSGPGEFLSLALVLILFLSWSPVPLTVQAIEEPMHLCNAPDSGSL